MKASRVVSAAPLRKAPPPARPQPSVRWIIGLTVRAILRRAWQVISQPGASNDTAIEAAPRMAASTTEPKMMTLAPEPPIDMPLRTAA